MKITLSHKEQQIFLAQCFWKGITDIEVLNYMLYHAQTSLEMPVKSPITHSNGRDSLFFAQTIEFQKVQTSF